KSESVRLVRDPKYRFVDFEDQINQAGYQLLNGNRIQEAMFVFGLNTELFPGSANAWDSYGEVHWKAGQKEKAVEYYRKAISLDPDGPIGENAR
ncbi:MAG: tetratricopeptide repeat protein, partial [Saprospiraceae bacterium]|nr:tetratricopeptide repeat protein [Saprospiraceae bacterium]